MSSKEINESNRNDKELLRTYIDDIKNMKSIDQNMLDNISKMPEQDKMEIIVVLNKIVNGMKEWIVIHR